MKSISWAILPAIILSFVYLFVPGFLWLINRAFHKPYGETIFNVTWNKWGISLATLSWIIDRFWVYFQQH